MKKTISLIVLLIISKFIFSQTFTKQSIWNEDKITAQDSRGILMDFEGDGDQDLLISGATNETKLRFFINDGNNLDSVITLLDDNVNLIQDFTVVDIDNDLDEDILVHFGGSAEFYTIENLGGGIYDAIKLIDSLINQPTISTIEHGDIDGDGFEDVIFSTFNPNEVRWSKNLGNFNFSSPDTIIATGTLGRINSIRMSDLDSDGDLDFITISDGFAYASINDGSGNFTLINLSNPANLTLSIEQSFALEDFNGDGYVDFGVSAIKQSGAIRGEAIIFWNDSTNHFGTSTTIKSYPLVGGYIPLNVTGFQTIDYDNDGDQDIVLGETTGSTGASGTILNNDGLGGFTAIQKNISNCLLEGSIGGSNYITEEVIGSDINNDGLMDVITISKGDKDVILHTQNADTTFSATYVNQYLTYVNRLQYIDVDNDGNKDVVAIDGALYGKMFVSYNDGSGNFLAEEVLHDNTSYFSQDLLLTNWDGDGMLDKIYATRNSVYLHANFQDENSDTVILLFRDQPNPYANGAIGIGNRYSEALSMNDIDNDGDMDLVIVLAQGASEVIWIENTGNFSFSERNVMNGEVSSYALGDLDEDNDIDFIGVVGTDIKTYHFDSITKTFSLNQTKTTSIFLNHQFVIADPDNDGDMDIVYSGLNWLENTDAMGTLSNEAVLLSGANTFSEIIATDLNNDGLIDFVSNDGSPSLQANLNIIMNQGGNSFSLNATIETTDGNKKTFVAGDVDNDGVVDVISGDYMSGSHLPVWFRTCFSTYSTMTDTVCDSMVSVSGRYTWTSTDIYTDTLVNASGCDSIITVDLTVYNSFDSLSVKEICEGDSIMIFGDYQTAAGVYIDSLTTINGCDSILVEELIVHPVYDSLLSAQVICSGDSVMIFGNYESEAGIYYDSLISINSCDSILIQELIVNPSFDSTLTAQTICSGDSVMIFGNYESVAGIYYDSLQTSRSCDSVIIQELIVNPVSDSMIVIAACNSYEFNGQIYNESGMYYDTLSNSHNCDSIITLDLTIDTIDNGVIANGQVLTSNATTASYQWLDCDSGYAIITGETNQVFTALSNGNYAVAVSENSCTDTSDCISINTVGIINLDKELDVKIYPNPSAGSLFVKMDRSETDFMLEMYNSIGKLLLNRNINNVTTELMTTNFERGVYFIKIFNDTESSIYRVVLN